jgi:hypothetical protein
MPRKTQILTTAGRRLECENKPDVLALVPVTLNATGEKTVQLMSICLDHAIDLAVWKFAQIVPASAIDGLSVPPAVAGG